jgi:hypothetical protein
MSEQAPGRGLGSRSVSERFERAKIEQLQRESKRLESFRQVDTRNKATPRGSLASRWEEVLTESKDDEKKKFESQKRQTITSFLSAYEAGLVRRRISHYESLFMQISASLEKIQATISASKRKSLDRESIEPITPSNALAEEPLSIDFLCGSTQNYHFSSESPLRNLLLNCLLANSRDPIPLLCGIYSLHDSPFEVVAVAMLDEVPDAPDEPFIAITITMLPQVEVTDDFFGLKKIAFFVPSGDDPDEKTLIWDPQFNILPPDGSSAAGDLDQGDATSSPNTSLPVGEVISSPASHSHISTPNDALSPGLVTPEPVRSRNPDFDVLSTEGDDKDRYGRGIGNYVSSSDSSVDEGIDTWKEVVPGSLSSPLRSACSLSPEVDQLLATQSEGGVTPAVEADIEEKSSIFSLARAKGMPEVRQFAMVPNGSSPPRSNFTDHDMIPWTEAEVKASSGVDLKVSQLDIQVRDIQSSSCCGDSVVFRLKSGVSLIVVSSLKFAISPSSFFVSGDVVFEWVRGVAKSGWLYKWPMKNQKAGMMTRRFFILRDRILSYHRVEPSSQEEASADYSMHSVKLKKGHYVHRSKHHMSSCVKVVCSHPSCLMPSARYRQ